jgi:prefoldin alpha subunit|tara:strand:+ start:14663 stop:15058 length:396 start_codon:yes stop_codon:yes gene_type:complete
MENKEQQEFLFKLSMFEQQIQQLQQQLEAVGQGIIELNFLSSGLNELIGSEGKEILAPIGKGIFVKTKLLSENLIMDVGGRNFVKKNIQETQETITEQIKKLEEVKEELDKNLKLVNEEIKKVVEKASIEK